MAFFPFIFKKKLWQRLFYCFIGFVCGILNGFFGSGGGMLCVPMLKTSGLDQKSAHATSICIILPLTLFSAILYLQNGDVMFKDAWPLLLPSLLGAICGAVFLKKISCLYLKRFFGAFIIFVSIRMLFMA